MSQFPSPEQDDDYRRMQRRGRIIGASIMAVILLPLLAAKLVYYTGIGLPTGTVNHGVLLEPPPALEELAPRTREGEPWTLAGQSGRWRLLIPGDGECGPTCRDNLYLTRQVHTRLADDSERLERVYLLTDDRLDAGTAGFMAREHPGLSFARVAPEALEALPSDVRSDHYFLMDPGGFVIMAYSPDHSGGELLDDLKQLLKFSQER